MSLMKSILHFVSQKFRRATCHSNCVYWLCHVTVTSLAKPSLSRAFQFAWSPLIVIISPHPLHLYFSLHLSPVSLSSSQLSRDKFNETRDGIFFYIIKQYIYQTYCWRNRGRNLNRIDSFPSPSSPGPVPRRQVI